MADSRNPTKRYKHCPHGVDSDQQLPQPEPTKPTVLQKQDDDPKPTNKKKKEKKVHASE
jgi:hypothetical protein